VSGWCITQAVDPVCFAAGTTIAAGGATVDEVTYDDADP